jgi:hypothetical protein
MFRRQFETAAETDVLHEIPKGATYDETLEALEDRLGDQHLAASYRT